MAKAKKTTQAKAKTPQQLGMERATRANKERFLAVFWNKRGNVHEACKEAKIGRSTYSLYRREDSVFSQACDDVLEGLKDYHEAKVAVAGEKGDWKASEAWLKAKAKERGWGTNDVKHSGTIDITVGYDPEFD